MRRAGRWVGLSLLALAVLAVLTVVPLRTEATQSQPVDVHAASSASNAPACATMALTGSLESTKRTPLIEWWGLADVAVELVAPRVAVGGDMECPEETDVASSAVLVYTPQCSSPAIVDNPDASYESLAEPQSRCGGNGVLLPVLVLTEGMDAEIEGYGDRTIPLGSSGIIAANQWCLSTDFTIAFEVSSGDVRAIDTVDGDLVQGDICVNLE